MRNKCFSSETLISEKISILHLPPCFILATFMKIWNQAPLVRLIIPFIAGIIAAIVYTEQIQAVAQILVFLLSLIGAIVLAPKFKINYKHSWWFGSCVNAILFLIAFQLTIFKTDKLKPNHFSKFCTTDSYAIARIHEPPTVKTKSVKIIADIITIRTNDSWTSTSGKALLYFKKSKQSEALKYGDELVIHTSFKEISPAQNPGSFDYKTFLANHNIFNQAYLDEDNWYDIHKNSGNAFLIYSYALRDKLLDLFRENEIEGKEFGVGAALLLGYTDKLDTDILTSYSNTGALHVLSVSGLHVAIIYLVLNWCLFFLDKFKHGTVIKALILLLFLWLYATLTGLSPSVLRAATMLSFVIVAKSFNRHTNIYNTLAASAFLLLSINPYLLTDVGFQLSYIAVIGIVYLQPKIYNWFSFNFWLFDQVWALTAVSVAAQLATFPLSLYYFHQFPNYFLFSNLAVIPLSTLVMYVGIAFMCLSKISILAKGLAWLFKWCVWLLNESVFQLEKLPFANLKAISITKWELALTYGFILVLLIFFLKQQTKHFLAAMFMFSLLLTLQLAEQNIQLKQQKLIVYATPKSSTIDFICGQKSFFLLGEKDNNESVNQYQQHQWELGIKETINVNETYKSEELRIEKNRIQFSNKRIAVLAPANYYPFITYAPFEVNYLIVSGNTESELTQALNQCAPKTVIVDASSTSSYSKKVKQECLKRNIAFFSVIESGAFVAEL